MYETSASDRSLFGVREMMNQHAGSIRDRKRAVIRAAERLPKARNAVERRALQVFIQSERDMINMDESDFQGVLARWNKRFQASGMKEVR